MQVHGLVSQMVSTLPCIETKTGETLSVLHVCTGLRQANFSGVINQGTCCLADIFPESDTETCGFNLTAKWTTKNSCHLQIGRKSPIR